MSKYATPLSSLLIPFFKILNERKLQYCVCGNYEQLPEFTSHDVDIWVKEVEKAEILLLDIAKRQGFRVHLVYKTGVGSNNFFLKCMDDGTFKFIRIDLMRHCAWRSIFTLVPAHIIGENLREFKGFYIPNPAVEASMQLLYPLISHKKIKNKYKKLIFRWRHHPFFVSILEKTIGQKYTEALVKQIELKDWPSIEKSVQKLRLSVVIRSVFANIRVEKNLVYLEAFKQYFSKFFHPKGIFVVFLGPDGCGKSSLCEIIPDVLQPGFLPGKVRKFYWRPMFLPPIRQLLLNFGIKSKPEEISLNSQHNVSPDNTIISTIKFIYYWFDFVIGRVKFYLVWAMGGIVLFDRYYYDFLVYPERFRLKLPRWLIKILMPAVPRPDINFYLDVDPKLLISRKEELSLDELKRQINYYQRLVSSLPNTYMIDASQSLDHVIENVSKIILDYMSRKATKK